MFTNTESLSKTKYNLTFRMGQKIKHQTLVQIFTKYWWILHILYFTRWCSDAVRVWWFSNYFTTNFSQDAL